MAQIVGDYADANHGFHGFVLSGGQYTTLDDPNAGTGFNQGTSSRRTCALSLPFEMRMSMTGEPSRLLRCDSTVAREDVFCTHKENVPP